MDDFVLMMFSVFLCHFEELNDIEIISTIVKAYALSRAVTTIEADEANASSDFLDKKKRETMTVLAFFSRFSFWGFQEFFSSVWFR